MPMTLTAAFATYGARLRNKLWAFSAIADDGALVMSCWHHLLKPSVDGHKRYEDRMSRWTGARHGKKLLASHLSLAVEENLPVHLVLATLDDPTQATDGDASKLKKTFSIDQGVVGRVVTFDGDLFAIEFK